MTSLKIAMNEPVHRCSARVLYGDTDAGGVVYYANYLKFFEMGRTEFMREYATSYREVEERGLIMPVVESYVRYKASAVYDDLVLIETSLVEVKSVSCRFNYRIFRADDNKMLVKGFTVHAVIDREGKLVKFPADLSTRLREILPSNR